MKRTAETERKGKCEIDISEAKRLLCQRLCHHVVPPKIFGFNKEIRSVLFNLHTYNGMKYI